MKTRVIVIGLDGATYDIIDPLLKKGLLPNIQKIFKSGCRSNLLSSVPPISAPAWVSFMTGKNSGKHGILGFQQHNLSKYNCFDHQIVSSNSYQKETIFDILTQHNKRSIAFQVPLTYPAWSINGIMVAGYPTPDQTRTFTYPEEVAARIDRLYDYQSDQIASGSSEEKINLYSNGLERISTIVENLLSTEDYDLFVYVNNITDWIQHKFWKQQFHNQVPQNVIDEFYVKIDQKIGQLLNLLDENTTIILMSDHGAGSRPTKFFNINNLLMQNGFLEKISGKISLISKTNKYWFEWIKEFYPMRYWTKADFSSDLRDYVLDTRVYKQFIDWNKTYAYRVPLAYPYVGVNLNVKNRQPDGIINEGRDFENYKTKIYSFLKEYSTNNPQNIKAVYRQEELFSGPFVENIPDIIVELNEEYDSGCEIDYLISDIPELLLQTVTGYHRPNGIFGIMGPNIKENSSINTINIMDITPTILYLLGMPVSNDIDGKIITDVFKEDYLIKNDPVYLYNSSNDLKSVEKDLTPEEEIEMVTALSEMGYM